MVDEAAAALVPGPVATTALATLVLPGSHAELLEALATGERTEDFTVEGHLTTNVGGTIEATVLSTPGMIGMMERTAAMLALE